MKPNKSLLLLCLAASFALPASASDAWSPLGLAFESGLVWSSGQGYLPKTSGVPSYDVNVYGIRLAFFGGANVRMYGLSLGVFGNGFVGDPGGDEDAAGFQIAGLVNDTKSSRYGLWQIAGLVNIMREDGFVVQAAGLVNVMRGDAGKGAQIAGVANRANKDFYGLQVAGVFNSVGWNFAGLQIAPINLVDGTMRGVQIGAVNYAKNVRGVQIGALNFVEQDFSGVALGAFNSWEKADATMLPILRVHF